MLIEGNLKNDSNIRRKAYNVDNPVQAKRSSGLWQQQPASQPRGLNYFVVPVESGFHSYPELRFACTGLSAFKTYGLAFGKQSY